MRFFLCLSVVGLVLSTLVHFSTYFGVDPQELGPAVWLLHVGIFVVFIPAMILTGQFSTGPAPKKADPEQAYAHAPAWMRRLLKAAFVYALINFAIFFVMTSAAPGDPVVTGPGTYALRGKHKKIIRTISAVEYHAYHGRIIRGFSGHWMAFYAVAMATITSAIARRRAVEPLPAMPAAASPDALPPPTPLPYGRVATRAPPLWVHGVLAFLCQMVCFAGFSALCVLLLTFRSDGRPVSWVIIPAVFGSAVGGLAVGTAVGRLFPARCPACGGRAFLVSRNPLSYLCRDCGRQHTDIYND